MHLRCLSEGQSSNRETRCFCLSHPSRLTEQHQWGLLQAGNALLLPVRMLHVTLSSCCFDCALKAPQGTRFVSHQQTSFSPRKKERLLPFAQVPRGSCDGVSSSSLAWICKQFHAQKGEPLWFRCWEVEANLLLQLWVARPFWNSDEDYKPSVFIAHNAICQGDTVMTGSRCLDPSTAEKPWKENHTVIFVFLFSYIR